MELEVGRIRELSRGGRHGEALDAAKILSASAPLNRDVWYLIAANQRCLNQIYEALETLRRLQQQQPGFSLLFQERGYCYTTLRDTPRAIDAFARAVELNPALTTSWTMLERLYLLTGDAKNSAAAAERIRALKHLPSDIVRAGSLFSDGDLADAEKILRTYLIKCGDHAEALRLLARIQHRYEVLDEAELLLAAALKLAPDYVAARLDLIRVLLDSQKYLQARQALDTLLRLEPGNSYYLSLHAAASVGLGEYERAVALYRQLLAASPDSADLQVSLGHALQTVGRQQEAIESYKMAATVRLGFGDAWWSLANLKTYRFSPNEIAQMRLEEAAPAAALADRYHLCFALGKAFEDQRDYAESWQFYQRGNAFKRSESRYDPEITAANTRRQIEACTAEFFAARKGLGVPDPDPIFVVGLPRSGSTLIEQILASHSQVEGTQELPEIQRIAVEIR